MRRQVQWRSRGKFLLYLRRDKTDLGTKPNKGTIVNINGTDILTYRYFLFLDFVITWVKTFIRLN